MTAESEIKDHDLIESGREESGKHLAIRHQEVTEKVAKKKDGSDKKKGGDDGDSLG